MKFGIIFLILLIVTVRAAGAAEPFSISCDGKVGRPYYVTLDLDSKRAVFQSTIRSFHKGEITKATDDSVLFSIAADHGRIDLVWQPQRQTMVWAGISADPIRPLMVHRCVATEMRTVLAIFDTDPVGVQPLSLRCEKLGQPYFVTMDRKTRRVAVELESGSTLPGKIMRAIENSIEMTVGHVPKFDLVWDSRAPSIKWIGVPGDKSRPDMTHACEAIKTRTVLDLRLWP